MTSRENDLCKKQKYNLKNLNKRFILKTSNEFTYTYKIRTAITTYFSKDL